MPERESPFEKPAGGAGLVVAAGGLAVGAAVLHAPLLAVGAGVSAVLGAIWLARSLRKQLLKVMDGHFGPPDPSGRLIGMGATVASDARIEAGAIIQMGATVGAGAIVKSGAVIRWGATVEDGAIIEEGVRIGWGVVVGRGAVVKTGANLAAGCVVEAGAVVADGAKVWPGTVITSTGAHDWSGTPLPGKPLAAAPMLPASKASADSRDTRIDELCDRLQAELAQSPQRVNEFLGKPGETVTALRRTCHDLLRRERSLRKESEPAELERLDTEGAALEARIAAEKDEIVRSRLGSALAALEDQRRQRALLLQSANRLEAEHTRLLWTLSGLLPQFIRVRTSDATSGDAIDRDLDRSLTKLRQEADAVADALAQVSEAPGPLALGPVSSPAESTDGETGSRGRGREH